MANITTLHQIRQLIGPKIRLKNEPFTHPHASQVKNTKQPTKKKKEFIHNNKKAQHSDIVPRKRDPVSQIGKESHDMQQSSMLAVVPWWAAAAASFIFCTFLLVLRIRLRLRGLKLRWCCSGLAVSSPAADAEPSWSTGRRSGVDINAGTNTNRQ